MLGWPGIFAWIAAAIIIGAMVFCFAEVASRFTGAGGAYLYADVAFGRFAGIQVGWLMYFARCITAAVQANLFTTYLAEFWPSAATRSGGIAVTTVFLGTLAVVNLRSVKQGANVSNFFAIVKVVPLLIFGAMGAAWLLGGHGVVTPAGSDPTSGGWLRALLLLMFGYGGFEAGLIPLAEAKNPKRDAPFALIVGLALVTLVYLAAQVTVLATLPNPGGSARPLADAARVIVGTGGAAFMAVAALLSVYGWLASNMLTVPRLSTAMADRGDFPKIFAWVHPRYRTPWVSIIFFAAVGWILAIQAGLLQNLSLSAVSRLIPYGVVCAALPVLRKKDGRGGQGEQGEQGERGEQEGGKAEFRVRGGVVLSVIGVLASLVLASRMNLRELIAMAVAVGLGTVYWMVTKREES
jgi:amino acid transporter